jgi:hypothetical protein
MPLVRGHHSFDDHFTQVPNAWLRDPNLSLGAKGLLAQLLSHAPGWEVSQESLARANKTGKDAIRTIIGELLSAGYLNRSTDRTRTEKGYLGGYVYTTQDPTTSDFPTLDKPTLDNPPHKNTITKEEQLKEIYPQENLGERFADYHFERFWELYPKKVEKIDARKAFRKALEEYDAKDVLDGVERLAADPNLPPKQFIPYPASWLRAGGWTNEPYPPREQTAEEKAERLAHQRRLEADKARRNTQNLLAEQKETEKQSAPPPKCHHGNTIVRCLTCLAESKSNT